jgi:hypothetical protein
MPNHTSCVLKVVGTRKAVKAFQRMAKSKDSIFSLNALIPMPPELLDVNSPVKIVSQAEYDKAAAELAKAKIKNTGAFIMGLPITAELQAEYLSKYGADNWYDWAIKNWGTKWDVYEVSEKWEEGDFNPESLPPSVGEIEADYQATCYFQTAWAPATDALVTFSKSHPELHFFIGYVDEFVGYMGYSIIGNGEEQENMLPPDPPNGEDQLKFRELCGHPIFDDEVSEEEDDETPKIGHAYNAG